MSSPRTGRRWRSRAGTFVPTSGLARPSQKPLTERSSASVLTLVICSRVTYTVRQRVANWFGLYPDHKPYSTFYIGGERKAKRDIHLSDLLALCASPP
jgi:hypothetical protein